MVDRILSRVDDSASLDGTPFVIWGLASAILNIDVALVVAHGAPPSLFWVSAAVLAIGIASTIYVGRQYRNSERRSLLSRHVGNVFIIGWLACMAMTLFGQNIFLNWGQSALWSLVFGAATMYCGTLARSRVAFAGGAVLILSIIAANYFPGHVGYILAAGDLIGLGGAGLTLLLQSRE